MCEKLGITDKVENDYTLKLVDNVTDMGPCCTIFVDQAKIKVGMMNGLTVLAYPDDVNKGGVYVGLHEKSDVPLMKNDGNFVEKGNDLYLIFPPLVICTNFFRKLSKIIALCFAEYMSLNFRNN